MVRSNWKGYPVRLKLEDLFPIVTYAERENSNAWVNSEFGLVKMMWIGDELLITSYRNFPRAVRIPANVQYMFKNMLRGAITIMSSSF